MRKMIVLGAGVVGMTSAYVLARKGYSVTVVDAGMEPAATGASFGNGAQLSYAYTDALASPALVKNLHKYVIGLDPAFRLRPTLSPEFWSWGLAFLANATQRRFEENTLDVMKLAMESRREIAEMGDGIDFDHRRSGKLNLYASPGAAEKATALMRLKNQHGAGQLLLTPEQAVEREPALSGYGHRLCAALWSPNDESGDSRKFCLELRRLLNTQYDVEFRFGTQVREIIHEKGRLAGLRTDQTIMEADRAVLAAGVATRDLARTAGIDLPIWGMQGYSLTVPATEMAPTASITDAARKVVFCRIGDRLRIAGLADIGSRTWRFQQSRFDQLVATAKGIFPRAADYSGELNAWTGIRPMTPDCRPIICRSKIDGLYLNCGHGSLGWTLSMGSAVRLAQLVD